MKKHEILSLQHSEKKDWLIRNVSDYKVKAFYGDLIGYIINVSDDHMEEYVSYPESYETGSVIKKEYPELSTIREEEINSGAPLTKQEIEIKVSTEQAVGAMFSNQMSPPFLLQLYQMMTLME